MSAVRAGPIRADPSVVSFGIYLFGIILVIAGLIYGAAMLNVPTHWIVMMSLIMLGAGVVTAVKATRQRDPAK
jgi:hypothetical protein